MLNFVKSQTAFKEMDSQGFKYFESEMKIPIINESLKYALTSDSCVFETSLNELQSFASDKQFENTEMENAFRDSRKKGIVLFMYLMKRRKILLTQC